MIEEYHKFLDKKSDSQIKKLALLMVGIAIVLITVLSFVNIAVVTPTLGALAAVLLYGATEIWWYRFASEKARARINFLDNKTSVTRILILVGIAIGWLLVFAIILQTRLLSTAFAGCMNIYVFLILIFAALRGPKITEEEVETFQQNLKRVPKKKLKKIEKAD